ncbi:MAG TPA: FecR family protein [Puia sp.]|jgi:ferric-dicitrate binding protein FerR (iron transport regulator)
MSEKRIWELLTRQFNNEISESELKELQSLIQNSGDGNLSSELLSKIHLMTFKPDPEDESSKKRSLDAIRKVIGSQNRTEDADQARRYDPDPAHRYDADQARRYEVTQPDLKQKRRSISFFLYAAVACAVIFITGYFLFKVGSGRSPAQFETIVTRAGSKTLINLPDSSTVLLNSASKFGYNKTFGIDGREMDLAGEAYFDIRKNAATPLVIHAGNVIIRVLGTTFNVRANPEDSYVEATLIRGVIEVSLRTDPERKILLRPNEKIVIRKSENLSSDKTADPLRKNNNEMITVTKVEPDPSDSSYVETVWTKDKMIFHKEAFTSLAKKMERWYNVRIILSDAGLNDMEFTGSLEKESLQEALNALQHLARFNYKIAGKTVTVTEKY